MGKKRIWKPMHAKQVGDPLNSRGSPQGRGKRRHLFSQKLPNPSFYDEVRKSLIWGHTLQSGAFGERFADSSCAPQRSAFGELLGSGLTSLLARHPGLKKKNEVHKWKIGFLSAFPQSEIGKDRSPAPKRFQAGPLKTCMALKFRLNPCVTTKNKHLIASTERWTYGGHLG